MGESFSGGVDALIIGTGVAGLFQLHRLQEAGFDVVALEAGGDVGGTWYWNRYPGARFDSESYTYQYGFSDELLDEWDWSEQFAAQPETLGYLQHVADRFDLRGRIRFGQRVTAATWREADRCWTVTTDTGTVWTTRWLITAMGNLTVPTWPAIEGRDEFTGAAFHTARWPAGTDLTGRRVGVIGTGATGVQVIQEMAKVAGHLTVFQRSANWCAPLGNRPIDPVSQAAIKDTQRALIARCRDTFGGFIHDSVRPKATETDPAERRAFWEHLYAEPGFGIWMGNYRDVLVDAEANRLLSEFVAGKIAERVHDPEIARRLTPTDHGFGTRRVPLETGYYEVYNEPNVELVDLRQTPIVRMSADGIVTTAGDHRLDVVIYATGFDAITGAFDRINVHGAGARRLRDDWSHGPVTYLAMQTPGYPNLFMLAGPHSATIFCNQPRCIEYNVDWLTDLLRHTRAAGASRVETADEAARAWTEHALDTVDRLLMGKVDSWFHGVNANLPDKPRVPMIYGGGFPLYREHCDAEAAAGYPGFSIE